MNKTARIVIVMLLVLVVGVVLALKQKDNRRTTSGKEEPRDVGKNETPATEETEGTESGPAPQADAGVPRLMDFGAATCIPCKLMAPILEGLKTEYAGRLQVDFMDIREDPALITLFGIRVMPTQIFYDAAGKELFRHEGFMSKEDILGKWKELGVDLSGSSLKQEGK